ncbi:hypothetical protein BO85DRAFT_298296 [Aspergillus piperis CBS 112811]|uniref:Uncharacterized protein n=1 Tax=Aspergillus piperis CBS 112811 TaxID=1448313 RepID=A0A8G1R274_9EURO|nr:hypothetical protein BO85DRAFT_298296 [Aspergillus piperis CBS 112811]RAH58213.1 hypothetical protein BO85DRAFT_298296 [Aspergillus piperis CBS 112811]
MEPRPYKHAFPGCCFRPSRVFFSSHHRKHSSVCLYVCTSSKVYLLLSLTTTPLFPIHVDCSFVLLLQLLIRCFPSGLPPSRPSPSLSVPLALSLSRFSLSLPSFFLLPFPLPPIHSSPSTFPLLHHPLSISTTFFQPFFISIHSSFNSLVI